MERDPLQHIRGISSGTLAGLCHARDYETIDRVQAEWYNFLLDEYETSGRIFQSWPMAWNAFVRAHSERGYQIITSELPPRRVPEGAR